MVDELQLVTPLLELSDVKRAIDVSCIRAVQSASCKPNFARVRAGELAATMRWAGTGATVRRKARRQTQCEHTQYRSSYERSLTDTLPPPTVVYTRCVYVNTCHWATCVCTFVGHMLPSNTPWAELHTTGSVIGGPARREMMPPLSSVKHLEMVSKDPLYVMPRRHNDQWHHENRKLIALPKPESFAE